MISVKVFIGIIAKNSFNILFATLREDKFFINFNMISIKQYNFILLIIIFLIINLYNKKNNNKRKKNEIFVIINYV